MSVVVALGGNALMRPGERGTAAEQLARFLVPELVDCLLVGAAEAPVDGRHLGEDEQPPGAEGAREQRRGAVLVDHRIDAGEPPAPADNGNPASAARDDDGAVVGQRPDLLELHHLERRRRRNDAPIAAVCVGDHRPAALALQLLALLTRIEGTDRLCRPVECWIVRCDAHVRQHACSRTRRCGSKLGRNQRSDLGLCLRDREPQRQRRRLLGSPLLPKQLVADLRTVPVRDDETRLVEERRERRDRAPQVRELLPNLAEGSMRPKVEAAVDFGGDALITSFDVLEAALRGETGTRITAG